MGALCSLGEPDAALSLVADPDPDVRAWLCSSLGAYRQQTGAPTLQRLRNDPNAEVAHAAETALRRLGRLARVEPGKAVHGDFDWARLLSKISEVRLADPEVAVEVPNATVQAGWLGEPGASEQQIEAAEVRLGIRFPPSYRDFLNEANGFHKLGHFIYRLFRVEEVDWFRNLNPDWIEAYQFGDDCSREEHLSDPSNVVCFRRSYLGSCLQVSAEGDSAVVLLNPEVITDDGEGETWFFANWAPGAERFPTFLKYMEIELERTRKLAKGE